MHGIVCITFINKGDVTAKDKKEIRQVVDKIFNWLQAAVGDLASDTTRYPDMMDEDVNKMIKGMRNEEKRSNRYHRLYCRSLL